MPPGSTPFPIKGIDSDNGSEFINHHLVASSSLMEAERISASIKLEDATVPVPTTRLGWQPIAQLVPVGQRRERRQR